MPRRAGLSKITPALNLAFGAPPSRREAVLLLGAVQALRPAPVLRRHDPALRAAPVLRRRASWARAYGRSFAGGPQLASSIRVPGPQFPMRAPAWVRLGTASPLRLPHPRSKGSLPRTYSRRPTGPRTLRSRAEDSGPR